MHLNVKLPHKNIEIDLETDASVEQLRAICAEKLESKPEDLVLVFKGKIMRDNDKLSQIDIVDGCSVHCAFKRVQSFTPSPGVASPQPKPTNNVSSVAVSNTPHAATPFGTTINSQNASAVFRALSENTDLARLLSDPTFMDQMMNMDPRLKGLMENHPEISAALRDPQVMRQVIELMKNPQALQEAMRSQDRILTQLQNTPGGLNSYMRLFNDINRASTQPPTGANVNTSSSAHSDSTTANVSGEAMPNPWADIVQSSFLASSNESRFKEMTAEARRLFNELVRILKFGDVPETVSSSAVLDRIRQHVANLSPRGQYGLTEFLKGHEVLKEECAELLIYMLNYQLGTMRIMRTPEEQVPVEQAEPVPQEAGNETTYQDQLVELSNMGFSNKEENLTALRHSFGDVTGAVNWILRRRGIE